MSRSGRQSIFLTVCSLTVFIEGVFAQSTKPLAYVRSIVVLPVVTKLASETDVPTGDLRFPGHSDKRSDEKLKQQRSFICRSAPQAVRNALRQVLLRTAGVGSVQERGGTPDGNVSLSAQEAAADAALAVVVDRCGLHAGLEREVWLRIRAKLADSRGRSTGPYYGVGRARATRRLIGKGLSRTDEELVAQAALQASGQLVRELRTGERSPFVTGGRVAMIRAMVPSEISKALGGEDAKAASQPVRLSSLRRQSDVLLQPDIPPTVEVLDTEEIDGAVRSMGVSLADFWSPSGQPEPDPIRRLAARLRADYVFLSWVREVACEESPVDVPDGRNLRSGREKKIEVTASAALYSVADDRILWQDTVEGGTIARTEYVRHMPRIRTDEQAVMDAVHTAYAYLRYSFDEFHRRYYR